MMHKEKLRQQALARRRAASAEHRQTASESIQRRLLEHLSRNARLGSAPLLLYRALNDEVATGLLFDEPGGREVYAPVTHHAGHMQWLRIDDDTVWQRGSFGVLEPAAGDPWPEEASPAVLVCPLVGFDRSGNRLGLGKGCFDRWLAGARSHILLSAGLAFACQECPAIPVEAHDVPLDIIITENEVITCRNC